MSLIALATLAIGVQGASLPQAKRDIQARYDEWSKAYVANDAETLVGMLDPSYTLTNSMKEVTSYATYAAYLRLKAKAGVKPPYKTVTRVHKIRLDKTDAIVEAVETMTQPSEDPKTHEPCTCVHRHIYEDSWRPYHSTWRLLSTVTLKETTEFRK